MQTDSSLVQDGYKENMAGKYWSAGRHRAAEHSVHMDLNTASESKAKFILQTAM